MPVNDLYAKNIIKWAKFGTMEQMPIYFQSIFEDFSLPQLLICNLIKIALCSLRAIHWQYSVKTLILVW